MARTLNAPGIGRGDRVAVVLPNGSELERDASSRWDILARLAGSGG